MQYEQQTPPPEANSAFLFMALALVVNVLWIFTVGFWSVIGFCLIFSFWKRQVTLTGMRNAERQSLDYEGLRVELRHLSSKLWMITVIQYIVWFVFWQSTKHTQS
jgi:hypothetical protein